MGQIPSLEETDAELRSIVIAFLAANVGMVPIHESGSLSPYDPDGYLKRAEQSGPVGRVRPRALRGDGGKRSPRPSVTLGHPAGLQDASRKPRGVFISFASWRL